MNADSPLPFDNSYARLPEHFYSRLQPTPVSRPALIRVNHSLATHLGIDPAWLESDIGVQTIAGNHVPEGADPIATAYAGHQFGGWNPQLGDGRAILLGELIGKDGVRYDLQLKGSGPTPYSRGGDGRSPLGPVIREYVVSEAMAALGIPTSRALAAVTSGETVVREELLPGAVLARVAQSHIRIGTFQFFAARKNTEALRQLVDHVIERHYPQARQADNPCRAMLDGVIASQANLVSLWQSVGFIHGVMNTDNMLLSGETIDYGPCAFMDEYHPETVFSSIDHGGRYAYRNQPGIAHWNLVQLAQALIPVLHEEQDQAIELAQKSIDAFPDLFEKAQRKIMQKKLGLTSYQAEDDRLITDLLALMGETKSDFTLTFRRLADVVDEDVATVGVGELYELPAAFTPWLRRWRERLTSEPQDLSQIQAAMYAVNPAFIARNHLVEEAIQTATHQNDFTPFHTLVELLANPYRYDPQYKRLAMPPLPEQVVDKTFCGT